MSDLKRVTWYRREREKALMTVPEINNGWRYYEQRKDGGLSDVTLARLQYSQKRADMYEKLEKLWRRNHGPRDVSD